MGLFVRDRSFYRKILVIGAPVAGQQLITVGVGMMDTVMLGQLKETALSAGSMAVQVHNLFHFMCMGLTMGAGVLIARYLGAEEKNSLYQALILMYRSCLLLIALFTVVVAAVPAQVMGFLTPDRAVIVEGVRYLRVALPCFFLYGLSTCTTNVLRNSGQMHIPLLTSIGAFFINIFFNWVFIFGKLGAPALGVAGAALGTLLSRAFEFACICGYFFFRDRRVHFRLRDLAQPCGDLLPEYVRVALPVMVSDTLLGVGNSVTVSIAGHIGRTFLSAHTITTVTQQVATVFSSSLGQAAVIITGNTLGEGETEKAQRQGVTFATLGVLVGLVCGGLIVLFSPVIVGYYNIEAETFAVAMELMGAVGLAAIFMVLGSILTKGVLRGGGDTRFLMAADVFFLWAVSAPLGYHAGLVWHWPPFWIFLCLRLDHLLKSVWCLFRLRSGKWIKRIKTV